MVERRQVLWVKIKAHITWGVNTNLKTGVPVEYGLIMTNILRIGMK